MGEGADGGTGSGGAETGVDSRDRDEPGWSDSDFAGIDTSSIDASGPGTSGYADSSGNVTTGTGQNVNAEGMSGLGSGGFGSTGTKSWSDYLDSFASYVTAFSVAGLPGVAARGLYDLGTYAYDHPETGPASRSQSQNYSDIGAGGSGPGADNSTVRLQRAQQMASDWNSYLASMNQKYKSGSTSNAGTSLLDEES